MYLDVYCTYELYVPNRCHRIQDVNYKMWTRTYDQEKQVKISTLPGFTHIYVHIDARENDIPVLRVKSQRQTSNIHDVAAFLHLRVAATTSNTCAEISV